MGRRTSRLGECVPCLFCTKHLGPKDRRVRELCPAVSWMRGAPCYGEDNEHVYGELLGMTKREIAELAADGVF
jgi:crotonobetainyl-CoA:carnitine CoA-transferase CaiB-like acyl-CoA transferase